MSMTLGERIKLARRTMCRTQAQLGKDIGVWPQHVSGWECGVARPSVSNLNNVAEALGVNPRWLVSGRGWMVESRTALRDYTWIQKILESKDVQGVVVITYRAGSSVGGTGYERKSFLVQSRLGTISLDGLTVRSRAVPLHHYMYCGLLELLIERKANTQFLVLSLEQSAKLSEIDLSSLVESATPSSEDALVEELKEYLGDTTVSVEEELNKLSRKGRLPRRGRPNRTARGEIERLLRKAGTHNVEGESTTSDPDARLLVRETLPDLTPMRELTLRLRELVPVVGQPGALPPSVVEGLLPALEELTAAARDLVEHLNILLERQQQPPASTPPPTLRGFRPKEAQRVQFGRDNRSHSSRRK